jgi:RNA polymerase sigma-70 factor (ECF subfamily)
MLATLVAQPARICWNPQVALRRPCSAMAMDGKSATGPQDDLRLMEGIKAGDVSALEAFHARYGRAVLGLCRRILGDPRDAEEATLDAFAQLWEHGDRYDPGRASPLSYLMTVARSRAIDRARAAGRHRLAASEADEGLLEALAAGAPGGPSPLAMLLTSESRGHVDRALRELSPDQRTALELAYYEGLSHREVAERLRAPLGTVKTRIRQGLIRLRDALDRALRETPR